MTEMSQAPAPKAAAHSEVVAPAHPGLEATLASLHVGQPIVDPTAKSRTEDEEMATPKV